jgi:hypothetical protein
MYFPMDALNEVLKACHGKRPAGDCAVMRTTIADVPLMVIASAWSQKGISYFLTTCRSTELGPVKYVSKFEDEWGHVGSPLLDRPMRKRQDLLELDK